MAQDHFELHNHDNSVRDWNFNVLFDDAPAVQAFARAHVPYLESSGFYEPIPPEWLHSTIMRVGVYEDFTETEMLQTAARAQEKLAKTELPEFTFGEPILLRGNLLFKIEPAEFFRPLFTAVSESLIEVVGEERTLRKPDYNFLAHMSLVYTKTREDEDDFIEKIKAAGIPKPTFRVNHFSLIKQCPTNGHYEWEIVKDIL